MNELNIHINKKSLKLAFLRLKDTISNSETAKTGTGRRVGGWELGDGWEIGEGGGRWETVERRWERRK